jgi:hypothetical protein
VKHFAKKVKISLSKLKTQNSKLPKNKKLERILSIPSSYAAEREGFEPPVPHGTTVFKTVAINQALPSLLFCACKCRKII